MATDGTPGLPEAPPAGGRARARQLIGGIRNSELAVDEAVLRLSRSRRWLAPLALTVGAVVMLFEGLRLLFTNWRLVLIQVLPAMWIWAAMWDLKAHVFRTRAFQVPEGPVEIPLVAAIAAITAASFFLNAVFAFSIVGPGPPLIRPAFARARSHLPVILGSGVTVGLLLGVAAVLTPRWGPLWFTISLSIVIGVMMVCYVAVPARVIGARTAPSKRDKLAATAVGCVVGVVVCTPAYVLGRLGLLLLGSGSLFVLGVIVFTVGLLLEAAATVAVKAVKMSAKLIARSPGTAPRASS
jgi:hypothetical protein